jgi:RNA polymerase sigma-70 factor (ECF subfamily)
MNTLTANSFLLSTPPTKTEDSELVARFQRGDESAFTQIVSAHRGRIYGYVRGMLRNETDAEEVTQDTFVRAYRSLDRFRGDASLTTWLHRIATNLARNRYWYFFRRRRQDTVSLDYTPEDSTNQPLLATMESEELDPSQHTSKEEFLSTVRSCVERIDPTFREAFELRAGKGLSYQEISQRTGAPVGTVKSRIARARRDLQSLLNEAMPDLQGDSHLDVLFERQRS